ncbi:UAA transporter, partial [Tulasnella sp. 427]
MLSTSVSLKLPAIHEQQEDGSDVFLLKSSFTAPRPAILVSSPNSIYIPSGHRRRSSAPTASLSSAKHQEDVPMATTTGHDASVAQQYWTPPAVINFPPSPTLSAVPSSRGPSSPVSSPLLTSTLPIPSAPPSPSPSPPPYSLTDDVGYDSPLAHKHHPQRHQKDLHSGMGTVVTSTILDPRYSQHKRPPALHKPSALRLVSSNAGKSRSSSASSNTSWRRFMHSGFTWIGLYFIFNMGLTLYNKTVLVHFPFPYSLTALHTLCGTIGCLWLKRIGYFTPARLTLRQNLTLAVFSVLYTLNIAVSNLSLQLVTVPFHQVVRASAPFFTILVAYILGASKSKGILGVGASKLLSLLPVIAGVGFATYGDYSFTAWGFILTLLGTFLAALKTVLTSILQTPSASSRLSTPLPVSTPIIGEYALPPSPTHSASGNITPPKSPFLSAHHTHAHAHTYSSHTLSSALAKRFAPVKRVLFRRFGYVTKRFDLDFGLSNQSVVSTSIKLHPLD